MYQQNNNQIRHLTQSMLVVLSLLGGNALAEQAQDSYATDIVPSNMAEEILLQGESALMQITHKWQRGMQDSLAGQIQQSSEALIAVNPVVAPQTHDGFRDNRIPGAQSVKKLPCDNHATAQFTEELRPVRGSMAKKS